MQKTSDRLRLLWMRRALSHCLSCSPIIYEDPENIGIGNGQPPLYPPTNCVITMECPSVWHGMSSPGSLVLLFDWPEIAHALWSTALDMHTKPSKRSSLLISPCLSLARDILFSLWLSFLFHFIK